MNSEPPGFRPYALIVLLLASLCWLIPSQVFAQDLEPRRWTHLPVGTSTFALGYAGQKSDIYFNPLVGITDGSATLNAWLARFSHSFDWSGKTARVDLMAPYISGTWQGLVDGEPGKRTIRAGGDPWLRLSVNLYGAPALNIEQFKDFKSKNPVRTMVGASVAVSLPWGSYDPQELINVGRNRYTIRPQVGVLHQRGAWSFELTSSVYLFTNNDDFVEAVRLSQDPVYALQAHVTRNFGDKFWLGAGMAYAAGGNVRLDNEKITYKVDNMLWNVMGSYRVTRNHSFMLAWQRGRTQVNVGTDTNSWLVSWVVAWNR